MVIRTALCATTRGGGHNENKKKERERYGAILRARV